jgi:superfamily II DNA or RNA helicase
MLPSFTPTHTEAQKLRPYQEDAIRAIVQAWQQGETPLAVLATGLGKSTILSELLVREFNPATQRALVIAHTQELIWQPKERIEQQFGSALAPYYGPEFKPGIGVVMAANDDVSARIIVATRQSLREARFKRVLEHGVIDILIIDEAHHAAPGSQYVDIVELCREANPNVKVVGFTATPKRTDKHALKLVFSKLAYNYGIVPAIKDGWLSPATRIKIKTPVDLRKVEKTAGDYKVDKLIAVLDAANWVQLAVDAYKKHVLDTGRQCLAFFPGVMESIQFTAALQAEGVSAAHVDANTPKDQRGSMLRDYKQGKLKVVSNMGVLTEGFDAAQTSAILMARPTKSETLFTQIVGRGLRIYPGKKDCLIIDLTFTDTNVLTVGTLLGELQTCHSPECLTEFYRGLKHCPQCGWLAKRPAVKLCPECECELPQNAKQCTECGYMFLSLPRDPDEGKTEQGAGLVEEIGSLFGSMSAAWHSGQDGWLSCGVGDQGAFVIAPPTYQDGSRLRERLQRGMNLTHYIEEELREELFSQIAMLERMLKRAEQHTLWFAPKNDWAAGLPPKPVEFIRGNADLASLISEADTEVLMRAGEQKNLSKKNSDWRIMPPSIGQVNFMRKLGIKIPDGCTKGEAASLITHTLALRDVEKFIKGDQLPEPVAEVES